MILDSSYIFELDSEDAFQRGVELAESGVTQRVPTPVVAEVRYGVESERGSATARAVENRLMGQTVEPVDEAVARKAAELLASADGEWGGDSGADLVDAMIAGVADTYGEPVLTENVRDFGRLGVAVETW
ncbi:MAG: PIN domain-containing protein [Haloferacaceae archaeon]